MSGSLQSLPVAHTCFFSVDLPDYDTYDLLKSKITYAFNNALIISDGDGELIIDI
jgi:hypothetical protein